MRFGFETTIRFPALPALQEAQEQAVANEVHRLHLISLELPQLVPSISSWPYGTVPKIPDPRLLRPPSFRRTNTSVLRTSGTRQQQQQQRISSSSCDSRRERISIDAAARRGKIARYLPSAGTWSGTRGSDTPSRSPSTLGGSHLDPNPASPIGAPLPFLLETSQIGRIAPTLSPLILVQHVDIYLSPPSHQPHHTSRVFFLAPQGFFPGHPHDADSCDTSSSRPGIARSRPFGSNPSVKSVPFASPTALSTTPLGYPTRPL
ncbi:hypothetical protein VTJ04DRAFT_3796 [Mycothermus thermophilus]|uniref:uncharacterized protein n=1 Tax=Humicola insolens TaxID=85995 RepID=UPI003743A37B